MNQLTMERQRPSKPTSTVSPSKPNSIPPFPLSSPNFSLPGIQISGRFWGGGGPLRGGARHGRPRLERMRVFWAAASAGGVWMVFQSAAASAGLPGQRHLARHVARQLHQQVDGLVLNRVSCGRQHLSGGRALEVGFRRGGSSGTCPFDGGLHVAIVFCWQPGVAICRCDLIGLGMTCVGRRIR